MKKAILLLSIIFALSSCAKQPDKLSTEYISPLNYQQTDCQQIELEMQHVSKRVCTLHKKLEKEANADAAQMCVGFVLFWPTLFFLEGGSGPEAVEYSRLKGEYAALRSVAIDKQCPCRDMPISPLASLEEVKKES